MFRIRINRDKYSDNKKGSACNLSIKLMENENNLKKDFDFLKQKINGKIKENEKIIEILNKKKEFKKIKKRKKVEINENIILFEKEIEILKKELEFLNILEEKINKAISLKKEQETLKLNENNETFYKKILEIIFYININFVLTNCDEIFECTLNNILKKLKENDLEEKKGEEQINIKEYVEIYEILKKIKINSEKYYEECISLAFEIFNNENLKKTENGMKILKIISNDFEITLNSGLTVLIKSLKIFEKNNEMGNRLINDICKILEENLKKN